MTLCFLNSNKKKLSHTHTTKQQSPYGAPVSISRQTKAHNNNSNAKNDYNHLTTIANSYCNAI